MGGSIRVLLISMLILGAGCTILSKKECESLNWHQRGVEAATSGKTVAAFKTDQKQCAEHGVSANPDRFSTGYAEGLKQFCTYDSGYRYGRENKDYQNTCPLAIETDFRRGYRLGKSEYELDRKEAELAKAQRQLGVQNTLKAKHVGNLCNFDHECTRPGFCSAGTCSDSGKVCTYSSDCDIKGRCEKDSEYVEGSTISVNYCAY